MRLLWLMAFSALVFTGCKQTRSAGTSATAKSAASAAGVPQKSRVTPAHDLFGKVVSVNANLRFVVIDFSFSQLPQVDQRFSLYRQGQKVGEVKISGPARDHNIAADIMAGEAMMGDEVRAF